MLSRFPAAPRQRILILSEQLLHSRGVAAADTLGDVLPGFTIRENVTTALLAVNAKARKQDGSWHG